MQVLPEKAVAVSPGRMGRPKLHVIATTIRLPQSVLERIDALLGENQRARFIREAVEAELSRREDESRRLVEKGLEKDG